MPDDIDAVLVGAGAPIVNMAGEIDEWLARKVTSGLMQLSRSHKEITLVITSGGGDVLSAHSIVGTIRALPSVVTAKVHGAAMSAAIYPLLACSHRYTTPESVFMVHGPSGLFHGSWRDLDTETQLFERLINIQAEMLTSATNLGKDHWVKILHDRTPTYYSAEEALSIGLVDRII